MFMNRIGDFGLALGIFCICVTFGAVVYFTVFALAPHYIFMILLIFFKYRFWLIIDLVGILLFIGAIGRSAQLRLHSCLPDHHARANLGAHA